MSWYTPWTREGIDVADLASLKEKLEHAQAEIGRLNEQGKLCTPAEHERMIEQRVTKNLQDRMETAERVISTTAADCNKRLAALEAPPKDLSDPYPKDGPNVRNQNAHEALSKWLRDVEERLRKVEGHVGGYDSIKEMCANHNKLVDRVGRVEANLPSRTGPRWRPVTGALSERLDKLEENSGNLSHNEIDVDIDLLEARLTALSETVAKNRKSYEADRGQRHHESRKSIKDRIDTLEGAVAENRKHHDALTDNAREEFCLSSGIVNVSADGVVRFSSERRVSQRRSGPTDRRKPLIGYRRRSEDNRPRIAEIERRQYSDRRQP